VSVGVVLSDAPFCERGGPVNRTLCYAHVVLSGTDHNTGFVSGIPCNSPHYKRKVDIVGVHSVRYSLWALANEGSITPMPRCSRVAEKMGNSDSP
jgi:hypothetical protein